MLERPDLEDERISACLATEYGLQVAEVAFLPLGADLNTAVYRVVADDHTPYFLKLRRGEFNAAAVTVPKYLSDLGVRQIIPALTTQTGHLWASLPPFKAILYPYVEGRHGFERSLSEQQWVEFGAALKKLHTAAAPPALTGGVPREGFSPRWRATVERFLARIETEAFDEPVAAEMAAFLRIKTGETSELITRTEQLAQILQARPPAFVLCHADIHAWNLLIADTGSFYMVDWDTLIFAPKERDLMFVGGGLGGNSYPPQQEEALFYQGYGRTEVDPVALAYYRYERIIEDIAVFCEQIFLSHEGGDDRKQALAYLRANFLPGGTLEMARQSDKAPSQPR